MFGFRNKILSASSLSPAAVTEHGWRLAEPAGATPARDFPLWRMSAAIVCMLGLPAVANAAFLYTPPDLAAGSDYRLIFTTSTTTKATSTSVSTYNSFVTSAAAGDPSLPATIWTAIASTSAKSALANLDSVCSTTACQDAPIYLVDGTTLVAATQAALFSGTLLDSSGPLTSQGVHLNQNGAGIGSAEEAWTGSNADGTVAAGHALGSANPEEGDPYNTNSFWLAAGTTSNGSSFPLYAISGQLTVPAPEPMSGALLLTGGVATGLVRRLRRRRQPVA
jgi:hypothetical protein